MRDLNEKNTLYEDKFLSKIAKMLSGDDAQIFEKISDVNGYDDLEFRENLAKLDEIGEILTVWNTDEKIREHLEPILNSDTIENILGKGLSFSGFCDLSFDSLNKITPFILAGERYDQAINMAKLQRRNEREQTEFLPPLSQDDENEITNPVVKRAIRQTIEVVNSIIKKHGSPYFVKIEAARDLAKNFDDRNKYKRVQDDNFAKNQAIKDNIEKMGIADPRGQDIIKYKLWQSQNGKSLYSNSTISSDRLFESGYTEIDHIIPFARCGNDSLDNKALVLSAENQTKMNRTLFEWKSKTSEWEAIKARIESLQISPRKKRNLLAENIALADAKNAWNVRAINDTRFISRFLRQYFEDCLELAPLDEDNKARAEKINRAKSNVFLCLRARSQAISGSVGGYRKCVRKIIYITHKMRR